MRIKNRGRQASEQAEPESDHYSEKASIDKTTHYSDIEEPYASQYTMNGDTGTNRAMDARAPALKIAQNDASVNENPLTNSMQSVSSDREARTVTEWTPLREPRLGAKLQNSNIEYNNLKQRRREVLSQKDDPTKVFSLASGDNLTAFQKLLSWIC